MVGTAHICALASIKRVLRRVPFKGRASAETETQARGAGCFVASMGNCGQSKIRRLSSAFVL
jgi:hypothetical protein